MIVIPEIEYIVMYVLAGSTVQQSAKDALILSLTHKVPVHFIFNGVPVIADASEALRGVLARYENDHDRDKL